MTFGVDGVGAHAEDGWRDVRVGEALLRVTGNVGRCAVTTRHVQTGLVDFPTLRHLPPIAAPSRRPSRCRSACTRACWSRDVCASAIR